MLTLFKKKQKPEKAIVPFGRGNDQPSWVFEGQSGLFPCEIPSAPDPPPYTDDIFVNLEIDAELCIHTTFHFKSYEQLIKVLDGVIDEYQGSYTWKEIILATYALLAVHFKQSSSGDRVKYQSSICDILTFNVSNPLTPHINKTCLTFNTKRMGHSFSVVFNFVGKIVKRKGTPYMTVYNIPMANGSNVPPLSQVLGDLQCKYYGDGQNQLILRTN
ncbi:matrix [Joinjakaka virus]|uniref:Matrix protein n=1 Tax=Joinjakaka virus TaxID=1272943 RepID=A0A0D3R257_9RHAB|nr:matrix [Joinjakaka virus]AJR28535.1 matrix [Joinjakaka virus]